MTKGETEVEADSVRRSETISMDPKQVVNWDPNDRRVNRTE